MSSSQARGNYLLAAAGPAVCNQLADQRQIAKGGKSKQRPTFAARERGISIVSCRACPVEVAHNDGVDLWIKRLDTRNRVVDKLAGGDPPRGEGL
jgi:hypothetical protein